MMTSKASSKVTNIASEKRNAVSSDFHQRDAADEAHEAGDEQEARDVEPQPLRQHAEEQRRHEHLQHAAQLRRGVRRSPAPCAAQERLDDAIDAGAARGSARDRTGNSRPAGPSRPSRCRCASCRSASSARKREQQQRRRRCRLRCRPRRVCAAVGRRRRFRVLARRAHGRSGTASESACQPR